MSDGYYFVNQSVVANKDTPAAEATTLSALKDVRLGAQVGTTSLATIQDVIAADGRSVGLRRQHAAIAALDADQIDAIVVDLPTAFFITAAQMDNGMIVGQIEQPEDADAEYFSAVLPKDSPLTDCVNQAIAAIAVGRPARRDHPGVAVGQGERAGPPALAEPLPTRSGSVRRLARHRSDRTDRSARASALSASQRPRTAGCVR